MDDAGIIALYWQREQAAVTETDKKYGGLCRSVSYRILTDREDAEECVSDTYLAAWNAIPPKRPRRLGAFLAAITRNISVSRLRERRSAKRGGGEYAAALDELAETLADRNGAPETAVELRELAQAVNAFLGGLSAEERKIFMCRYWLLASVAETAQTLGCTQAKVKTTLCRTRRRLRGYLTEEGLL